MDGIPITLSIIAREDWIELMSKGSVIAPSNKDLHATVRISFPSGDAAEAVRRALDVDEELQPNRVTRTLTTDGSILIV